MTYEHFLKQLKKVRAQHQTPMVKLNFALQTKKPDHYSKMERGLEEMTVREFLQICAFWRLEPRDFFDKVTYHLLDKNYLLKCLDMVDTNDYDLIREFIRPIIKRNKRL